MNVALLSPEGALVHARMGFGKQFVLSAPSAVPVARQAASLFESVSCSMAERGGWLIDELSGAASSRSFAALMERREAGDLRWDALCPWPSGETEESAMRPRLFQKMPYTMLGRAGYPCWAAQGNTFTIDLFNPTNELKLPYTEGERRLWAIMPFPGRGDIRGSVLLDAIKRSAEALDVDVGFGGAGLAPAVVAYTFAGEYQQLKPSDRLTAMLFQSMVIRAQDLGSERVERLQAILESESARSTAATVERFGADRFIYFSLAQDLSATNDDLGEEIARLLGRPYVVSQLLGARRSNEQTRSAGDRCDS